MASLLGFAFASDSSTLGAHPMLRQLRRGRSAGILFGLWCSGPAELIDVLEALDQWLVAYHKGGVHLGGTRDARAESLAVAIGLLDPARSPITQVDELEALVAAAVEAEGPAAAQRLLQLAAVGLDDRRYRPTMLPTRVRVIGEAGLLGCRSLATQHYVMEVARGRQTFLHDRDLAEAVQAAALRALGSYGQPAFRPALEQQLSNPSARLQVAAAEGLMRLRADASLNALVAALETERDSAVLLTIAAAASTIVRARRAALEPLRLQRVARAAGAALGRASWRADIALIDLLESCRRPEAVTPLIEVLQRFARQGRSAAGARPSGLLRERAHGALVSLTGLQHPPDQPASWRHAWSRLEGDFEVPAESTRPETTSAARFFGLPIHGTRVVFAVDLSGSMEFPFRSGTSRLQVVQRALEKAIDDLPKSTSFDIVCFAEGVSRWNGQLQPATPANKKRCRGFVRSMQPEGGTNTWGALTEAMHLHSRPYGKPCNIDVDELFLLSDGIPTLGHVVDAQAILQLVAAGNSFASVRVNTVYLAPQLTPRDEDGERKMGMRARDFMKQLAEQNGGRFAEQF